MTTPIADLARRLAGANDSHGLSDANVRTLQDAIVEQGDVTSEDRSFLLSFLDSNGGRLISESRRQAVKKFLDMPSHDLRGMMMEAERDDGVIDEAEAMVMVGHAEDSGGLQGAEKYSLEAMRVAFNVDPRAEQALRKRTNKLAFQTVVNRATQDGELSDEEYRNDVRPAIDNTPNRWSPEAQIALKTRLSGGVTMNDGVRNDLDRRLAGRGMDIRNGQTVEGVDAIHVTKPDETFDTLAKNAGVGDDATGLVGIIDGGFDVNHPLIRDRIAENEGEIPNNALDDDGNGYRDDRHGINGYGISGRRIVRGDHADIGTDSRGNHHGNHVTAIATRGTDRLDAVLAADSQSGIAEAIDYVVGRGAKVVNISQGVFDDDIEPVLDAMDRHRDVLFVHSAGNGATDFQNVDAPERWLTGRDRPNLIHIAAADLEGTPLPDTNRGAKFVHLAAQGKFFSATNDGLDDQDTGDGSYVFQGKTSQASPNVANVAAKMRILAPSIEASTLKSMLVESSRTEANWDGLVASGGRMDSQRAMAWAAAAELVRGGASVSSAIGQLGLTGQTAAFVAQHL